MMMIKTAYRKAVEGPTNTLAEDKQKTAKKRTKVTNLEPVKMCSQTVQQHNAILGSGCTIPTNSQHIVEKHALWNIQPLSLSI